MRVLYFLILLFSAGIVQAQISHSIGFGFKAGTPHSKVSGANDYKADLKKSFGINLMAPGLNYQYRIDDWSFQVGGWYMMQKLKYKDETVVNYGYADVFGENIRFATKMNFIEIDLGVRKSFNLSQSASPFIGIHTTGSFFQTSPLKFNARGQGSWGNAKGNYEISSAFPSSFNLGIRPELGFSMVSKKGREISFSYNYNFGFSNILEGTYTAKTNNNVLLSHNKFESSGNYTSITMRYQVTLKEVSRQDKEKHLLAKKDKQAERMANKLEKEKEKEKQKLVSTPVERTKYKKGKPVEHKGRPIKIQKEITVSSPTIDLFVWDSGAKEDGDSISVYVNDELILSNHGLTKAKDTITVTLKPDQPNVIIIFAHNEGTEPPNTASIGYILPSGGENIFQVYSKVNQSGAIIIKYKP